MYKYLKRLIAFFYLLFFKYIFPNKSKANYGYWFYVDGNSKHLLDHKLTPNSIVFEIGGYTGVFTEELRNKFDCIVYVFEPVNKFFKVLESKFKEDPKVRLFNHGLSDLSKNETINLQGDASSTILSKAGTEEEIQLIDINEFLINHPEVTDIDLVNMNIEGGEYALLQRMIDMKLINRVQSLQVQFHNYFPEAKEKRLDLIKKLEESHIHYFSLPFIWDQFKLK